MADSLRATAIRIHQALEDAGRALERLAELLAEERRLLAQRAPAQLESLALEKQSVVTELERADAARKVALQEAGYGSHTQAMEQFLQTPEAHALVGLWAAFIARLGEVRVRNEENGLAIRRSHEIVKAELRLLHGSAGDTQETLYNAAGASDHLVRSRILSSV